MMNTISSRYVVWMVLLAGGLCWKCPALAAAITGSEVIARMQKEFAEYKTFSAEFEKQFYWAVLDKRRSSQGKIYTRKPNQFRLELEDGSLVVADGEAIWAYTKQNEQVVVSTYADELKTPWEILVDYTENYVTQAVEEAKLDGRSCYLLNLRPRVASSYVTQMRVWVERKHWHLLKVEQVEVNDNVTTYILKAHRTNKKLDRELFHFEGPEGVEVIDRRETDSGDD